jgi:cobalt/nickel transport system permease protein
MHIMEGFLPLPWCVLWFAISIPIVAYGLHKTSRVVKAHPETKPLLAVAGAFILVLSSLKLPSVTGSCSHPTGTGLAVVLFGPGITSVLSIITLVFQALLLAHGGLTTLGANTFSMGISGPVAGLLVFKGCRKIGTSNSVSMFLTASVADLFTYVVTSIQLALVYQGPGGFADSFMKFGTVFAITQVPLAIAEGVLSVFVFDFVVKYRGDVLTRIKGGVEAAVLKGGETF